MMWVPQQQISAVQGSEEVTLDCVVEAHPEALTFWEKGGRMLQTCLLYTSPRPRD